MADPASSGSLPDSIVQSIAISNAKSIGEQPAILANLALANQILNNNLQQQMIISTQQAMSQILMATMARCVTAIIDGKGASGVAVAELLSTMKGFSAEQTVTPTAPAASTGDGTA